MAILDSDVNNNVRLNMIPGKRRPRVHCSQYDVGRVITLNLYNADDLYLIPSGAYVTIEGQKPDGGAYAYGVISELDGTAEAGTNVVTFKLVSQMANVSGETECECVIYNAQGRTNIGSLNFSLVVEDAPISEGKTDSNTDFSGLIGAINSATDATNSAAYATRRANQVLNDAIGKVVSYELVNDNTLFITANPTE